MAQLIAWCFIAACLIATPQLAAGKIAAEYYVDALAGNDANTGTSPEAAWKTLSKVNATTFQPGDSILLKAGSAWDGQLWPKGSGAPGQPIHVGKYGHGAKPMIRGNGAVEDTVLLKNQEYWELEDLEVSNAGKTAAIRRGVHLAVEDFGEAHHLVVRRMTIHDVSGRDDSKQNGGITITAEGERKPSRFVDVLIEDNDLYYVDRNGISSWSDRWQRSKWFPSLGVVVRGNRLRDIGGDGIMIAVTDAALLERNVVARANQRSEGYNVAIWTWSADNSVIQFNEAYETKGQRDGEGFDSDWNSRNTVIQYNYSHDNDGGFLLICNDGSQRALDSIGNVGTIVRYNISQNDRHRGITVSGPVQDTLIYNNTLYIGASQNVDEILFTDWSGWSSKTAFFSNIFYALGEARIGHAVSRAADGAHTSAPSLGGSQGNQFDSNVYFGRIHATEDVHAMTVDPLFAAAGKGGAGRETLRGYALQSGSKARSSGAHVHQNGGKDFFGTTLVHCAAVDRGAVQSSPCPER
ncbi:MAG: right-handed parallel beta-helix repeat-containing protein [Candidatus Acidiferrum sp.]